MILYRLFVSLAFPVLVLRLLWRARKGRETWRGLGQRLGGGVGAEKGAPVIWLHGASNGELTSVRALVETALKRDRELQIIVTANTETGVRLAAGWRLGRLTAQLAPLDHRAVLSRFMRNWRPSALVVLESEFWPNRFAACAKRGIPVVVFAARCSDRALRRWRLLPWLTRQVFANITWLSAQDDASADRFRQLGIADKRIGPVVNLKSTASLEGPDRKEVQRLAAFGRRATTFLAASTHEGEDGPLIEGFAAAHRRLPALRMILAPRHPNRARKIRKLMAATGLPFAVRSEGHVPGLDTALYLADTLGEMALWYHVAGITFVGGSLVDAGGHTPFEPAAARSAILHGPHVANFRSTYAALDATFGALEIDGAAALAAALVELSDAKTQSRMTEAAAAALIDAVGPRRAEALYRELAEVTGRPALARKPPAR